jgi:hypothetical protein
MRWRHVCLAGCALSCPGWPMLHPSEVGVANVSGMLMSASWHCYENAGEFARS